MPNNNKAMDNNDYLSFSHGNPVKQSDLLSSYLSSPAVKAFAEHIAQKEITKAHLTGLQGSSRALLATATALSVTQSHLFVLPDKEAAAFFFGDIEQLLDEENNDFSERRSIFFPDSSGTKKDGKGDRRAHV